MTFAIFGIFALTLAALCWWLLGKLPPSTLPATEATNEEALVTATATTPHVDKKEKKSVKFAATDSGDGATAKRTPRLVLSTRPVPLASSPTTT